MTDSTPPQHRSRQEEFQPAEDRAAGASAGPAAEFRGFLARTRKWWLIPIILSLLLIGSLILATETSVAPFIYELF